MSKVTLDRETFKALASETRLQILHALDERRKTGTELARELSLNKATVHEHLQTLVAAGLVTKKDDGRKWIYWELSWEGSKLLHPGQGAVFSVLLGLGILSTGGGLLALGSAFDWWRDTMATRSADEGGALSPAEDTADSPESAESTESAGGSEETAMAEESNDLGKTPAEGGEEMASGGFDGLTVGAVMLFLTALVALFAALWLRRRR